MKKNKFIIFFLLISTLACGISFSDSKNPISFNTGDYIEFGKYLNSPILWKVMEIDENENPVLISENILTFKSFDAQEEDTSDFDFNGAIGLDQVLPESTGYTNGCNNWSSSSLRQWLNSSEKNITWKNRIPDKKGSILSYDKEAGFLSSENFSNEEVAVILPYKHKLILTSHSKCDPIGGSEEFNGNPYIKKETIIGNYNNGKYTEIEDKVSLMSINDFKNWNEKLKLKYAKSATETAYNQVISKGYEIDSDSLHPYWTKTPVEYNSNSSLLVPTYEAEFDEGEILPFDANVYGIGVAPVIVLNKDNLSGIFGSGMKADPIKIIFANSSEKATPLERPENNVGKYISFGKYYDQPILWRIINYSSQYGYQLFSDSIICAKVYDASGKMHKEVSRRADYGSNYWGDSNIRQWLNSYKAEVSWINNPPSEDNVNQNPYDKEKGFLADGNFTEKERSLMTPVKHKTLLNSIDYKKANTGSQAQNWNYDNGMSLENPETTYYEELIDTAYLISYEELNNFVISRGWDYNAVPTKKAQEMSTYRYYNLFAEEEWSYYLRDSYENPNYKNFDSGSDLFIIDLNGQMKIRHFHSGATGIRPCINIKKDFSNSFDGVGTKENPLKLK